MLSSARSIIYNWNFTVPCPLSPNLLLSHLPLPSFPPLVDQVADGLCSHRVYRARPLSLSPTSSATITCHMTLPLPSSDTSVHASNLTLGSCLHCVSGRARGRGSVRVLGVGPVPLGASPLSSQPACVVGDPHHGWMSVEVNICRKPLSPVTRSSDVYHDVMSIFRISSVPLPPTARIHAYPFFYVVHITQFDTATYTLPPFYSDICFLNSRSHSRTYLHCRTDNF